jgi:hypothetical protein
MEVKDLKEVQVQAQVEDHKDLKVVKVTNPLVEQDILEE